jgi:hypothetical protein
MDRECRRNGSPSSESAPNGIAQWRVERPDVFPELPEMRHAGAKSQDPEIAPSSLFGRVDLSVLRM